MSAASVLQEVPRSRIGGQPLRLVAPLAPDRVSRGVFAVIVVFVLALGLLSILLVNTMVAQGAFAVSGLKAEQTQLDERAQLLHEAISAAAAPAALRAAARRLGMVQGKDPAFIRVTDGRVLGKPSVTKGKRAASSAGSRDAG